MCVSNVFCTENQTKLVAQQNAKPTLKKNRSALASRSRNTALNAQLYRDQLVKIINVPEVSLQRLFGLLVYSITKMYLFQEQTVLTVIDECIVGFLEDWKKQHEGHGTDKSILQFLIGKVYPGADLGKLERGCSKKILLINVHLFIKINTFYCYYREQERNSYNTDDKTFFY